MTEEKKDDLNEQQTFLTDHEELLESINNKEDVPDEQPETVEPAGEAPVVEDAPAGSEDPVPEAPEPLEDPAVEEAPEPVAEAPVAKPQPIAQKLGGKKKKKAPQQPQHSPQHEEVLRQQALEQKEVKEVLVFLRKYAKPAAIAIVVICAIVLVDKFLKAQRYKKEAAADTALMHAQSTENLQDIVNDYASTPAAPPVPIVTVSVTPRSAPR